MNSDTHRRIPVAAAIVALTLAVIALGAGARDSERKDKDERRKPKVVQLKDALLKIELNSTDQDAGVQAFIDADPWKTMRIFDPSGRLIYKATTRGSLAKQGGTELFLESGEPNFSEVSLEEFPQRFPEGNYRIIGEGIDGDPLVGVARFTHNLADGPVLVSPPEDAVVDPDNLVVEWQPVAAANGSPIVGYQVLVVKPDSGIPAIPTNQPRCNDAAHGDEPGRSTRISAPGFGV